MRTRAGIGLALLALGACSGSESIGGPDSPEFLTLDPRFDVTELADGGECPDLYYEQTEELPNGATVTWTHALAGFAYEAGTTYPADVMWSVEGGTGQYEGFTQRNGPNTWTPRSGKDSGVDGQMTAGSPGVGSLPIEVIMDPMKPVGNSADGDDEWSGQIGTGHFWLWLRIEGADGKFKSVRLGVNMHLEDPAEGQEARCPGAGPALPPPPPPPIPAVYTVGGTVSGLAGTVVLRNNGGDDLSVSTNGGFTFASALADGDAYAVTVGTQPAGQTCEATNGTGTIAGADVTDVSVICTDDPAPPPPSTTVSYSSDVQPFFDTECTACHQGSNPPKGVNLTSYANVMSGGDSGAIVIPGNADGSILIQQLEGGHRNQAQSDIDMIRTWIQEGADQN